MNMFETSAIMNPILGLVVGIRMVRGSPLSGIVSAASIGLMVGMTVHSVPVVLGRIIDKLLTMTARGKDVARFRVALLNLLLFLTPATPIATLFATRALVKAILM